MIAAVTGAIVNNSGAAGNVAATYIGLPVISFGMEEYVNGNINGTLANFASVFSYGFTAAIKLPVN